MLIPDTWIPDMERKRDLPKTANHTKMISNQLGNEDVGVCLSGAELPNKLGVCGNTIGTLSTGHLT